MLKNSKQVLKFKVSEKRLKLGIRNIIFLILSLLIISTNVFSQFNWLDNRLYEITSSFASDNDDLNNAETFLWQYPPPNIRLNQGVSFGDSLNVRLIGRWANGPCFAVDVAGNLAYFGNGAYLEIVDFSNPARPSELGKITLPSTVRDVKVRGTYAYVANDIAGLRIIDVSDPSHPQEVGSYDTPDRAFGLDLLSTSVYLADAESGLRVIDVSNPGLPEEIGFYDTPGRALKIAITNFYAYVADEDSGLRVIDISNPAQPGEKGHCPTGSAAMDVAIGDNYAYIYIAAQFDGLGVIDVSKPYDPTPVGFYNTNGAATGIAVRGTYVYIADGSSGLRIIDIADPNNPNEDGFYDTAGYAYGVTWSEPYVFIADGHNGIRMIDVADPYQPMESGYFNTDGNSRGVTVNGNYAYLANGEAGLRIIDINNPTQPFKIGSLSLPGFAADVTINGNYAYVTTGEHGLHIIDITDPSQPTEMGHIKQDVYAQGVRVSGNYAYVADRTTGLRIIDVSNRWQPILIGSFAVPGARVDGIAIAENYVYLAAGNDGLRIIDISDPKNPTQIGFHDTKGMAISVAVDEKYAYIGIHQNTLRIFDITNPAQPIEVASYSMNNSLFELNVRARFLYVANETAGLRVLDIFDPSNTVELGYYQTGGTAYGVTTDNNYIYLADGSDGLYILEFLGTSLNIAPQAPTLSSPANNSYINRATPQLTWQVPPDENGDLLHFELELDKDGDWSNIDYVIESKHNPNGFSPIPPISQGSGSMNYTVQLPLSEGNWFWRVSAWDGLAFSEYSDIWHFIVDITEPIINSLTFENPGYGEAWFNPGKDSSVTLVVSYDERYPEKGSLSGNILADTLLVPNLVAGFGQVVRFNFSIANQSDGNYPLLASIRDSAGNIGNQEGVINLDATPPFGYYSDAPNTSIAGQPFNVHVFGASDGQGSGIAELYLNYFTNAQEEPNTAQDSLAGATEPGIYYYRYFAVDYLGNRGEIKTDTTIVFAVISQAPIIPSPSSKEIKAGEEFWLDINVGTEHEPAENLFGVNFVLRYSKTLYIDVVSSDSIVPGELLGEDIIVDSLQVDDENRILKVDIKRKPGSGGVNGYGTVFRIKYVSNSETPHETPIQFWFSSATAVDPFRNSIKLIPKDTTILIIQPQIDFTMVVEPNGQRINPGDSANFTISFEPLGQFNSQVSLEVTGLPNGMTTIYPSQPFDIPTSFTISFATTDEITPGVYHPIITATGGGVTKADTVIIEVLSISIVDFSITVIPDIQTIYPGDSTTFTLSFQPIGDFNSQISLKLSDLPIGMKASYPSEPFTIPDKFNVLFSTTGDISPDAYRPIIMATGGGITHQVTVIITVLSKTEPGPQSFGAIPNPFTPNDDGFNDYVEFRFPETIEGRMIILIFEINGRKVREIRHSRFWYGKDDDGRSVKPGAYIYIVKDGQKVIAKGVISVAL